MSIDAVDRRILDELQRDGAAVRRRCRGKLGLFHDLLAPHPAASNRIGSDPETGRPARPRRQARNPRRDGLYVHVQALEPGRDALARFERATRDRPEVLESLHADRASGTSASASSPTT